MTAGSKASAEARPGRFQAYSEHSGSGVEWLGETPAHWEVKRLTDLATLVNGFPFDSKLFDRSHGTPLVRIRDLFNATTEVNWAGDPVPEAAIDDDDILIGMDGDFSVAWWGRGSALLNQRLCCVRAASARVSQRYLFYCLRFPLRALNDVTHSTTVKHLSSFDVLKFRLPFPPLDEQQAIADFLDRETAKIDALVAKKERLIELLQEKRTALITRAVTRGLDPKVPMKDSGVEWLGEVPTEWDVRRLKLLLQEPLHYGANEPAELMDPDLPRYIRITDIGEDGRLREETFRSIPEDAARPHLLREGDLLFARSGATVGKTFRFGMNCGRAAHAGYLVRARFNPLKCISRFVQYFTLSTKYWDWLRSSFIQATIQNVSADRYAKLEVPLPQLPDRQAIVVFLDSETARIDALIDKVRQAIDHIHEFRTALISAAVTGKIDVRKAKPQ